MWRFLEFLLHKDWETFRANSVTGCCTPTPLSNVLTKNQLPIPDVFWDIATIFSYSRSLQHGQRSNQGHTMTLHTNPLANFPTMYQPPTPYGLLVIPQTNFTFWTRFSNSRSLGQGQRSNQGQTMAWHTYTPNQCPYQVSISYTLWFLSYSLDYLFPAAHSSACLYIQMPWVKTIPTQPLKAVG